MKIIIFFAAYACLLCAPLALYAKGRTNCDMGLQRLHIIENKGQVTDKDGNPRRDIRFRVSGDDHISLLVGAGTIHYQFYSQYSPKLRGSGTHQSVFNEHGNVKAAVNRMDVTFVGANPKAEVVAENKQEYYENYYTSWFKGVAQAFGKVTYKNIYPNIDWVLYIKDNVPEYDFIVHPGGNPRDIRLQYDGAEIRRENNSLRATALGGVIYEGGLYCYEQESGRKVAVNINIHSNRVSFNTGKCTETLVIDPVICWSTYFGGASFDYGTSVACDSFGRVYISGYTASAANIATSGSYQDSLAGTVDAFIACFSDTGTLKWATLLRRPYLYLQQRSSIG